MLRATYEKHFNRPSHGIHLKRLKRVNVRIGAKYNVDSMLDGGYARVGEASDELVEQIKTLSYTQKLWKMFRVIIHNAVTRIGSAIGCSAQDVMDDARVEGVVTELFYSAIYFFR